MGILDDAIREHLELKRQHGADRADVERLEQEAFGPATRPGDPEFDTGTEAAAPAAPDAAEDAPGPAVAEQPAAPAEGAEPEDGFTDWFAEDETTVAPAAAAAPEAPPAPEPEAAPGPEASDVSAAERARIEHADLGDTADHPAPEQLGPADEAEPTPREPSPSSEPPVADAPAVEQPAAPAEPEPAAEEAPPEPPESGIFDFDGEEEADEDPAAEAPVTAPAPTTDHDLPPAPVERPAAPAEGSGEGEDLLEETPDFLQDAPEGEDLWFEQGPPQDFDFDDED